MNSTNTSRGPRAKKTLRSLLPLALAVAVAFVLTLPCHAKAQTLVTLHSFSGGSDGANPEAGLVLANGTAYGTTYGDYGVEGTVFSIGTNGGALTVLHSFLGRPTDTDGIRPSAGLIISGDTLYGTTFEGGTSGSRGTVFAINTNGSGEVVLHNFYVDPGDDAEGPAGELLLSGGTLYGTTREGGSGNTGTIFAMNTDGTSYRILHSFTPQNSGKNEDGYDPVGGLLLVNDTLYGAAGGGGPNGSGTIFAIGTNGEDFRLLYTFGPANGPYLTNEDGAGPNRLVLSGNTLYGTTSGGGTSGVGVVFKLNLDGTGFSVLHTFSPKITTVNGDTNPDGLYPNALIWSGTTLYGTASSGGVSGGGTAFGLKTDGTEFTVLHAFSPTLSPNYTNWDGRQPYGSLAIADGILYGTTSIGGSFGMGTVFSIALTTEAPQLSITPALSGVVLTWPTNATGFTLQSAPDLTGTFTNVPNATNPFTNPATAPQQFFRLISN